MQLCHKLPGGHLAGDPTAGCLAGHLAWLADFTLLTNHVRALLSLVPRLCPALQLLLTCLLQPSIILPPCAPAQWPYLLHPCLSHLLSTLLHQSSPPGFRVLHLLPVPHSAAVWLPIAAVAVPVQPCVSESCPGSPAGSTHPPPAGWMVTAQSEAHSLSLYPPLFFFSFSFLLFCLLCSFLLGQHTFCYQYVILRYNICLIWLNSVLEHPF